MNRVYIDAMPLASPHMSGIGHTVLSTIQALEKVLPAEDELKLVIPFNKVAALEQYGFTRAMFKKIYLPATIMKALMRLRLLPFMDIFLGRGVYIFMNYQNWPLLFSKNITYMHDLCFVAHPGWVQPRNQRFLEKHASLWLKRADIVAVVSSNTKRELKRYYNVPSSKVRVVPNGVDEKLFYPRSQKQIATTRKSLALSKPYILHVGNFEPRKNLGRLIEAYVALPAKLRDAYTLLLVGADGWLNDGLTAQIAELQRQGRDIVIPSHRLSDEELGIVTSGATLMAYPTLYEGFGLPPLQAMAAGVPVVVADNSSVPEVVGDAGVYFEATDTAAITAALKRVLTNEPLRKKLISLGAAQAKKYTWEASGRALSSVIKELSHA